MSNTKQPIKRVGIRGYAIKADGIIYAESSAAAMRKLGHDLLRCADESEASKENETNHESVFGRGGMFVEEMR